MTLPARPRLLGMFALGLALALAGCTGGGDGDAQEVRTDEGEIVGCETQPAGEPNPGGDDLTTHDELQNEVDAPPGC